MELEGKVCLVTGASRGIGRAVALALIDAGATVAAAASTTELLGELGAASTHAADLSDPGNAEALAEEVLEQHGQVDVLINNAGYRKDQLITHVDLDELDRSFQINALSPFVLAGRLGAGMADRGEGAIVSLIAPQVSPGRRGMALYAASKASLESLTTTLRQELGAKGVLVLGFDPGWVHTELAPDGKEEPEPVAARLVEHLRSTAKSPREWVS